MLVNTTEVVDRGNRPNISQRIGLRVFFINDGAYVDPYEISSVQLFARGSTLSPYTVLGGAGSENLVTSVPLMAYAASGQNIANQAVHCTRTTYGDLPYDDPCQGAFDVDNYNPGVTASGIYRVGTGEYVVVLDQIVGATQGMGLSGWDWSTNTTCAASSLSSVNDYVDLWTVKLSSGSKYQVITNQFHLYEDTFFAFTEPLLLTTNNKLLNKHVRYKEVIDVKVTTETTLQNKNISKSIQNIFKDSVVTEATVTIKKVNQDPTFDGPFTVVEEETMEITSDNTLIFNWDTQATISELVTDPTVSFGSPTGTYSVQVDYTVLNQTIKSPLYYLTVS